MCCPSCFSGFVENTGHHTLENCTQCRKGSNIHASIRGGSRLIGSKGVSVSRSNVSFYLGTEGGGARRQMFRSIYRRATR